MNPSMTDLRPSRAPMQGAYMNRAVFRAAIAALLVASVASCSDSPTESGNESRESSELNLLHVTYDYPKLATPSATFWAVKGRAGGVDLWYRARTGSSDSAKFVE